MIKAAAMRMPSGTIHTDTRHAYIIKKLAEKGVNPILIRRAAQGFVTTSGYFVNRKDAMLIAKESGQIPETHKGLVLYSEDIFNSDGSMIHYKEDL